MDRSIIKYLQNNTTEKSITFIRENTLVKLVPLRPVPILRTGRREFSLHIIIRFFSHTYV